MSELAEYEKCKSYILSSLYVDPGLDCRNVEGKPEEIPYVKSITLMNKAYDDEPVSIILECWESSLGYRLLLDSDNPFIERLEEVARASLEKFSKAGITVDVVIR